MSTAQNEPLTATLSRETNSGAAKGQWIVNRHQDLALFILTPLLIVPIAWLLRSCWKDLSIEMLSTLVAAFGALGHHLPGMIRAYGDRILFRRYRERFIIAPVAMLITCIYFSQQHLSAMLLVLAVWGYWHGMMQLYGFVRIYDVKVGCTSRVTAYWDWLVCVFGFGLAILFSNGQLAAVLHRWYSSGGPLVQPQNVIILRYVILAATVVVLVGFLANYLFQLRRGPRPNPIKLLILTTGIGFWWFCMVGIQNLVIGIALFEVFHDVQYLAIVWLYNRRRVETNPHVGAFLRFLFQRNGWMILLYLGLILSYGTISLASVLSQHEIVRTTLTGIVWASTMLHFYFDGFIWKVRDSSTRAGLGLSAERPSQGSLASGGIASLHLLKWVPLVIFVGWLTFSELSGSVLTSTGSEERLWPDDFYLERHQNLAEIASGDLRSQRLAATTLSNLGRTQEAIAKFSEIVRQHPSDTESHRLLGEMYFRLGRTDEALASYELAVSCAVSETDRLSAHYRLGELYMTRNNVTKAEQEFRAALTIAPDFEPAKSGLKKLAQQSK